MGAAIKVKCIYKYRDSNNKIIGYKLVDQYGNAKDIESNNLKRLIKANNLDVINLKLTQDNRLIDSTESTENNKGNGLENFIIKDVRFIEVLTERCDIMYCMRAYFLKEDLREFEGVLDEAMEIEAEDMKDPDAIYNLLDKAKEYRKLYNKPVLVRIFMNSLSRCMIKTNKINKLYRAFTSMSIEDRVGIPVDDWLGKTISLIGYTSTTMDPNEAKQYATGELGYGSEGKVALLDIDVKGTIGCIPLGKPPEDNNLSKYEIGLINPKFRIKQKVKDSSKIVLYKADLVI